MTLPSWMGPKLPELEDKATRLTLALEWIDTALAEGPIDPSASVGLLETMGFDPSLLQDPEFVAGWLNDHHEYALRKIRVILTGEDEPRPKVPHGPHPQSNWLPDHFR